MTRHTIHEGRRRLRILLAEDNQVNRRVATRLLEKQGHVVVGVENGLQAVREIEAHRFDAVLMDVQMPEMDGLEAATAIRLLEQRRGGYVPIIALTAHALKGDDQRCFAAGMDAYVSKPIDREELFETLNRVVDSSNGPRAQG